MMIRDKMTLASASVIPRYLTASIVMVTSAGGDDSDNVIHQNIIWTGPVEHRCFSSQAVDGKKKTFSHKSFSIKPNLASLLLNEHQFHADITGSGVE